MIYNVPKEYFFRIHHIRPRFKNDIENVLFFMATEIVKLPALNSDVFKEKLNFAIRQYPGNATIKQKTIDNWRTEISALFGFIQRDSFAKTSRPSAIAINLAEEQDLVQFFKYFLYYFQYPGGNLKRDKNRILVNAGVKFKPVQYILRLMEAGEKSTGKRFYLDKAEVTHYIYNDLRVTRDDRIPQEVVELILQNRESKVEYDWQGDVIRYAGDIMDYMVIANLLVGYPNGRYYLNRSERESIIAFIQSSLWFNEYYTFFKNNKPPDIKIVDDNWFNYVNAKISQEIFKTDVLKYLNIEEESYTEIVNSAVEAAENELTFEENAKTKEIGDLGENLVIGHESMRLKDAGREKLIHLIKKIPTHLAIGYDIQSLELNEIKRLIEVKTTISNRPISFYSFHLTSNEWNAAQSYNDKYFVYRLMISKEEKKLFIIKDPIAKYKDNKLIMTPRHGADISFNEQSGHWEELLIWKS